MEELTVEKHLAAWADLISCIFLGIAVLLGGLTPSRPVWGRSLIQNTLLIITMVFNILFSAGRFIAEGILVEPGPREFLLITVVYSARWLWLFVSISKKGTRAAKAFDVAKVLRDLKMIRFGNSTQEGRRGRPELVIRKGARVVDDIHGMEYWRGVEEKVEYHEHVDTYEVRLVEQELHSDTLDAIGTVEFKEKLETFNIRTDDLYKKFYDLVRKVDFIPDLVADYGPFLDEFSAISPNTGQAQNAGATHDDMLGNVARRVAADACYYIWNAKAELRTRRHVEVINECIEDAARRILGTEDNV